MVGREKVRLWRSPAGVIGVRQEGRAREQAVKNGANSDLEGVREHFSFIPYCAASVKLSIGNVRLLQSQTV